MVLEELLLEHRLGGYLNNLLTGVLVLGLKTKRQRKIRLQKV